MKNIKTYTQSLNEESEKEALDRALRYAVMFSTSAHVNGLLDSGADPNSADPYDGSTALHKAAFLGYENMSKILIERGADPNQEDKSGRIPLRRHLDGSSDPPTDKDVAFTRFMILNGTNPLKVFGTLENMTDYFGGDLDWMPEELMAKIKRMQRGKRAFGM